MATYKPQIDHIADGAPGYASRVRTPDQQLESNIQYLKSLVDSANLGQALFYRDVAVSASTVVGMPVYWHAANGCFEPALAAVVNDPASGTLRDADSANVVGVVYKKSTSTVADLLVLGVAELDISAVVDGTVTAGRYYLSGAAAGKLVQQRPPVSVPVLHVFSNNKVLVVPAVKDFLNDHVHFQYYLEPVPAGTHVPPSPGGTHTITSPDPTIKGWLPANHSVFNGQAPTGACFGYNLSAHSELNKVWPPIPTEAAHVLVLRPKSGDDPLNGLEVMPEDLVQIDQNGIWWMTDCYDQVPWPTDYTGPYTPPPGCPTMPYMRVILSFLRMTFATDKTVVTSVSSDTKLISVVDCDGKPASVGDLHLQLTLGFMLTDTGVLGHSVVKAFDQSTLQFQSGDVTEGLIPGANISLNSSTVRHLDPSDPSTPLVYQGIVTVAADVDPTGKELPVELFRLDDTRQRFTGVVTYLAFLTSSESSLLAKIHVPPTGIGSSPTVMLRLLLYGDANGTPPALTLKYTRVPRPASPISLPTSWTTGTINVPGVGAIVGGQYFEVESSPITVAAGDTLFVELTRAGNDGYAGELGLIRMGAVL